MRHAMKNQVRKRIIQGNGNVIAENDKRLKAEFSYKEMEKAVRVFLELTKQLKQDAVLHGGCRLTVYYSHEGNESEH